MDSQIIEWAVNLSVRCAVNWSVSCAVNCADGQSAGQVGSNWLGEQSAGQEGSQLVMTGGQETSQVDSQKNASNK